MKNFLQLTLVAALFLVHAIPAYAAPSIAWSTELVNTNGSITGTLTVSGVTPSSPPLAVILFSDSDAEFNPYISHAFLGAATNGNLPITIPSDGSLTHFLAVIVDTASYQGGFSPFTSAGQFQVYSVGQVATVGGGNNPPTDDGNNPPGGGNNPPTNDDETQTGEAIGWPQQVIDNPLQVSDLNNFIIGLLNALLKIGIPVITLFLVYSGLRFVMARGNEKELASAKDNLLWVIIGIAILFGAWTIVKVLKGTFDEIDLAYVNTFINVIS